MKLCRAASWDVVSIATITLGFESMACCASASPVVSGQHARRRRRLGAGALHDTHLVVADKTFSKLRQEMQAAKWLACLGYIWGASAWEIPLRFEGGPLPKWFASC